MSSKLQLELRIDWADMDLYGHVNNIAYARYVQSARVNLWEQLEITGPAQQQAIPVLAATSIDFLKELHYPGNILVKSHCTKTGHTSYTLEHEIFNEAGICCAIAKDVIVMVNPTTGEKTPLSEKLKLQLMTTYC